MLSKNRFALAALAAAMSLIPAVANAASQAGPDRPQSSGSPSANENHLLLGLGVLAYRSPFDGEGTSVFPIPIVSARWGDFYADGLEAGVSYSPTKWGDFSPSFDLFIAARAIAGENREEITGDVGARASLDTPAGAFSLSYRQDVTGDFDGSEVTARYEYDLSVGPFSITPGVQANWLDRETANHLYGITAEQRQDMIDDGADVILPVFVVREKSVNIGADVTVVMPITERFVAIAYLSGTYLDSPIRNNPGITEDFEAQAMLGVGYRF